MNLVGFGSLEFQQKKNKIKNSKLDFSRNLMESPIQDYNGNFELS